MENSKIKIIRPTSSDYSKLMYPSLPIHGLWFDRYGFEIGDTVLIANPDHGFLEATCLANDHGIANSSKSKPREKTLWTSPYGHALLMLQGRWFFKYGFAVGDEVQITNPKLGIVRIAVIRTAEQIQSEKDKLIQLAKAEWEEFNTLLRA